MDEITEPSLVRSWINDAYTCFQNELEEIHSLTAESEERKLEQQIEHLRASNLTERSASVVHRGASRPTRRAKTAQHGIDEMSLLAAAERERQVQENIEALRRRCDNSSYARLCRQYESERQQVERTVEPVKQRERSELEFFRSRHAEFFQMEDVVDGKRFASKQARGGCDRALPISLLNSPSSVTVGGGSTRPTDIGSSTSLRGLDQSSSFPKKPRSAPAMSKGVWRESVGELQLPNCLPPGSHASEGMRLEQPQLQATPLVVHLEESSLPPIEKVQDFVIDALKFATDHNKRLHDEYGFKAVVPGESSSNPQGTRTDSLSSQTQVQGFAEGTLEKRLAQHRPGVDLELPKFFLDTYPPGVNQPEAPTDFVSNVPLTVKGYRRERRQHPPHSGTAISTMSSRGDGSRTSKEGKLSPQRRPTASRVSMGLPLGIESSNRNHVVHLRACVGDRVTTTLRFTNRNADRHRLRVHASSHPWLTCVCVGVAPVAGKVGKCVDGDMPISCGGFIEAEVAFEPLHLFEPVLDTVVKIGVARERNGRKGEGSSWNFFEVPLRCETHVPLPALFNLIVQPPKLKRLNASLAAAEESSHGEAPPAWEVAAPRAEAPPTTALIPVPFKRLTGVPRPGSPFLSFSPLESIQFGYTLVMSTTSHDIYVENKGSACAWGFSCSSSSFSVRLHSAAAPPSALGPSPNALGTGPAGEATKLSVMLQRDEGIALTIVFHPQEEGEISGALHMVLYEVPRGAGAAALPPSGGCRVAAQYSFPLSGSGVVPELSLSHMGGCRLERLASNGGEGGEEVTWPHYFLEGATPLVTSTFVTEVMNHSPLPLPFHWRVEVNRTLEEEDDAAVPNDSLEAKKRGEKKSMARLLDDSSDEEVEGEELDSLLAPGRGSKSAFQLTQGRSEEPIVEISPASGVLPAGASMSFTVSITPLLAMPLLTSFALFVEGLPDPEKMPEGGDPSETLNMLEIAAESSVASPNEELFAAGTSGGPKLVMSPDWEGVDQRVVEVLHRRKLIPSARLCHASLLKSAPVGTEEAGEDVDLYADPFIAAAPLVTLQDPKEEPDTYLLGFFAHLQPMLPQAVLIPQRFLETVECLIRYENYRRATLMNRSSRKLHFYFDPTAEECGERHRWPQHSSENVSIEFFPRTGEIEPWGSISITVRFVVHRCGVYKERVNLYIPEVMELTPPNAACSHDVEVEVIGVGPSVHTSCTSIDYGLIELGREAPASFTVTNDNPISVTIDLGDPLGRQPPRFVFLPPTFVLAPGDSIEVTVYRKAVSTEDGQTFFELAVRSGATIAIETRATIQDPMLMLESAVVNYGRVPEAIWQEKHFYVSNLTALDNAFTLQLISPPSPFMELQFEPQHRIRAGERGRGILIRARFHHNEEAEVKLERLRRKAKSAGDGSPSLEDMPNSSLTHDSYRALLGLCSVRNKQQLLVEVCCECVDQLTLSVNAAPIRMKNTIKAMTLALHHFFSCPSVSNGTPPAGDKSRLDLTMDLQKSALVSSAMFDCINAEEGVSTHVQLVRAACWGETPINVFVKAMLWNLIESEVLGGEEEAIEAETPEGTRVDRPLAAVVPFHALCHPLRFRSVLSSQWPVTVTCFCLLFRNFTGCCSAYHLEVLNYYSIDFMLETFLGTDGSLQVRDESSPTFGHSPKKGWPSRVEDLDGVRASPGSGSAPSSRRRRGPLRVTEGGESAVPLLQGERANFWTTMINGVERMERANLESLQGAQQLLLDGRGCCTLLSSMEGPVQPHDCIPIPGLMAMNVPGKYEEKIRVGFDDMARPVDVSLTWEVEGKPLLLDPTTSGLTTSGTQDLLLMPSVIASVGSSRRHLRLINRLPRDINVEVAIFLTSVNFIVQAINEEEDASKVVLQLQPLSAAAKKKQSIGRGEATVTPCVFFMKANSTKELCLEYKPDIQVVKSVLQRVLGHETGDGMASISSSSLCDVDEEGGKESARLASPTTARQEVPWDGSVLIRAELADSEYNDSFYIDEFYELHKEEYPSLRMLEGVRGGVGGDLAMPNAGASDGKELTETQMLLRPNKSKKRRGVHILDVCRPLRTRHHVVRKNKILFPSPAERFRLEKELHAQGWRVIQKEFFACSIPPCIANSMMMQTGVAKSSFGSFGESTAPSERGLLHEDPSSGGADGGLLDLPIGGSVAHVEALLRFEVPSRPGSEGVRPSSRGLATARPGSRRVMRLGDTQDSSGAVDEKGGSHLGEGAASKDTPQKEEADDHEREEIASDSSSSGSEEGEDVIAAVEATSQSMRPMEQLIREEQERRRLLLYVLKRREEKRLESRSYYTPIELLLRARCGIPCVDVQPAMTGVVFPPFRVGQWCGRTVRLTNYNSAALYFALEVDSAFQIVALELIPSQVESDPLTEAELEEGGKAACKRGGGAGGNRKTHPARRHVRSLKMDESSGNGTPFLPFATMVIDGRLVYVLHCMDILDVTIEVRHPELEASRTDPLYSQRRTLEGALMLYYYDGAAATAARSPLSTARPSRGLSLHATLPESVSLGQSPSLALQGSNTMDDTATGVPSPDRREEEENSGLAANSGSNLQPRSGASTAQPSPSPVPSILGPQQSAAEQRVHLLVRFASPDVWLSPLVSWFKPGERAHDGRPQPRAVQYLEISNGKDEAAAFRLVHVPREEALRDPFIGSLEAYATHLSIHAPREDLTAQRKMEEVRNMPSHYAPEGEPDMVVVDDPSVFECSITEGVVPAATIGGVPGSTRISVCFRSPHSNVRFEAFFRLWINDKESKVFFLIRGDSRETEI